MTALNARIGGIWLAGLLCLFIMGQAVSVQAKEAPAPVAGAVQAAQDRIAEAADDLDDYDEEEVASIADPLESWNRFWFRFNDIFYMHVVEPTYSGWTSIAPSPVRTGLKNIWRNLLFPMRFVNNVLQGRPMEAGVEMSRFIVNMAGGFGMIDVSKNYGTVVPVHPEGENFGQTLGRWGFGHGAYIVWPFIGPSSVRETFGWCGDYFAYPTYAAGLIPDTVWYINDAVQLGLVFNDVDERLSTYTSLRGAAVDPYIMMREAYVRFRAIQVAR